MFKHTTRRSLVLGAAAASAGLALPASALAQASSAAKAPLVGPLAPNPAEFKKTVEQFTGGKATQPEGLLLDVPVLADNPSAVPVKVKVTLPISEQDWCEEIILLAELNPSPLACPSAVHGRSGHRRSRSAHSPVPVADRVCPGTHEKRQGVASQTSHYRCRQRLRHVNQ